MGCTEYKSFEKSGSIVFNGGISLFSTFDVYDGDAGRLEFGEDAISSVLSMNVQDSFGPRCFISLNVAESCSTGLGQSLLG